MFISLRRKLGLKKKKRRKERVIIALILQERRTAPAPRKDNLPLFPDTWGGVYFLPRRTAGGALPAFPREGLGMGPPTPGGVSLWGLGHRLLPTCRGWVSKPQTPVLGVGGGETWHPGLGLDPQVPHPHPPLVWHSHSQP